MAVTKSHHKILNDYLMRWKIRIVLKILIIALPASFLIYKSLNAFGIGSSVIYTFLFFIIISFFLSIYLKLNKIHLREVGQLLDRQVKEIEDSSHLLLQSEDLNLISRIQFEKISEYLKNRNIKLKLPVNFRYSLFIAIFFLLISFLPSFLAKNEIPIESENSTSDVAESSKEIAPLSISKSIIRITPPEYAGLKSFTQNEFHLEIAEGSRVSWELEFNKPINAVQFIWGIDQLNRMKSKEGIYTFSSHIYGSGFYSFEIAGSEDTLRTELYRVDIINDLPPKITASHNELYRRFTFNPEIQIPVEAGISDDYGLTDAYIVATVSKGSGEGIKFREEKIEFSQQIEGKNAKVSQTLNGTVLGLEPGSELYYFIEAFDNKTPERNRSRTETFFMVIEDTASTEYADFGSLAVDLMPDYFRSQRQIIIETEKLIRDKPKLATKDFKFISNELGFDQKVLRLKYSQFLGEEFESGVELESDETPPQDEALQILEESHEHDEELDPEAEEDPLEEVSHSHDTEEETSYFSISVESKLRAALVEMWDAELYLRLYKPETSLPYQYRALELIKEIKNHARIYVQRVGFEPPPLTEEKRLKGKMNDVDPQPKVGLGSDIEKYPNIILATTLLDNAILAERNLTDAEKSILMACGNEIAYLVDTNPLEYFDILQVIKRIAESTTQESTSLINLKSDLYKILARHSREPDSKSVSKDPLKANYFNSDRNF